MRISGTKYSTQRSQRQDGIEGVVGFSRHCVLLFDITDLLRRKLGKFHWTAMPVPIRAS